MGLGITGVVASGALLVKQTLTVEPMINDHKIRLDQAKNTPDSSDKVVTQVYIHTAKEMVVHYGPAVSVGLLGLTAILVSNGILERRNAALVAAYQTVSTAFGEYRRRVQEEIGEERERDVYLGIRKEEVKDEETHEVKSEHTIETDPNKISPYAKFFDEYNQYWMKTPEYNLLFLRQKQSYFNDLLYARGHVFLNEVYKELGIPETQAGAIVGWTIDPEGDNYVDFGIYELHSQEARDFVNGYEKSIRLDFNVNGPILQKLPKGY